MLKKSGAKIFERRSSFLHMSFFRQVRFLACELITDRMFDDGKRFSAAFMNLSESTIGRNVSTLLF